MLINLVSKEERTHSEDELESDNEDYEEEEVMTDDEDNQKAQIKLQSEELRVTVKTFND